MHEQALAELAMLAGPAGALRPPELPSASGAAEVAELRLQEQLAMHQHRRQPSLPRDWGRGMSAAVPPLPDASSSMVLRTSTAPPAVTALLARAAAEQRRQQEQQQQQFQQAPLPQSQPPQEGLQKPAEQAIPRMLGLESAGVCVQDVCRTCDDACACMRGLACWLRSPTCSFPPSCCAEDTVAPPGPSTSFVSSGGSSASEPQRASGAPLRKPLPPVPSGVSLTGGGGESLAPLQTMPAVPGSGELAAPGRGEAASKACATAPTSPQGAAEPAGAAEGLAPRSSILHRLLSMPAAAWRGRSESGAVEAPQQLGAADCCQSSGPSVYSVGSVGPWTASLAELSSECVCVCAHPPVLARMQWCGWCCGYPSTFQLPLPTAACPSHQRPICRRPGLARQREHPAREPVGCQPPRPAQPAEPALQRRLALVAWHGRGCAGRHAEQLLQCSAACPVSPLCSPERLPLPRRCGRRSPRQP